MIFAVGARSSAIALVIIAVASMAVSCELPFEITFTSEKPRGKKCPVGVAYIVDGKCTCRNVGFVYQDGKCVECDPSCEGIECGFNACGISCGTCGNGEWCDSELNECMDCADFDSDAFPECDVCGKAAPGLCMGSLLVACDNQAPRRIDCAQQGKACIAQTDRVFCGEPCSPTQTPRCDGNVLLSCIDGNLERTDCRALEQTCRTDSQGIGSCGQVCPPGLTAEGDCDGAFLRRCDGDLFVNVDCASLAATCQEGADGISRCVAACPSDVDSKGRCQGSRLLRCDVETLVDVDCGASGLSCLVDAAGQAYCGTPCPNDLDSFGYCDGGIVRKCLGGRTTEEDCAAEGSVCDQITRYGAGCRGCNGVGSTGLCTSDGRAQYCGPGEILWEEDCAERGGTCGWDETRCRYACLNVAAPACSGWGLGLGQSSCYQDAATGFWQSVTCASAGLQYRECAAATDGSVRCEVDSSGVATCQNCLDSTIARCTDRNIAVNCPNEWLDCSFFESECRVEGGLAYCACTELDSAAESCLDGRRFRCNAGRIVEEPCACPS